MKIDFAKKKIAILGYGIENRALLEWFVKHGANDITICDRNAKLQVISYKLQVRNFKFQLGKDYLKNLKQFDLIFRSPGVPYLTSEIQAAKKAGTVVSSQMKLFFDLCPAKIVGVTGTKGKGTTTALIAEILKRSMRSSRSRRSNRTIRTNEVIERLERGGADRAVFMGGNIGNPPIEFLDKLQSNDWVVLELSSFQLQDLAKSPHIAVVLDIKSDHLDYHRDRKEYIGAKMNIVRYQSKKDFAVINLDYLTSFKFAAVSPTDNDYYFSRRKSVDLGCYVEWSPRDQGVRFGTIILRTRRRDYEICKIHEIILRGEHNLENICAAITAAYLVGARISVIQEVVSTFRGLEHRLEYVAEINGVKYYNDSFSTTPDTALAAIKSFSEPMVILIGGSEKRADYSALGREIAKSTVKALIPIGRTAERVISALKQAGVKAIKNIKIEKDCPTMKEAVEIAYKNSRQGDVVILSPASASFDRFKNYKDRGNQFKTAVREILK